MRKGQRFCMEPQAIAIILPIDGVPEERMTNPLKMGAKLMGASRDGYQVKARMVGCT